jgi:hypothetical protein
MQFKYPEKNEIISLIARLEFRKFSEGDWYSWSGCESKEPLIAEYDDHYTVIIDGVYVLITHTDDLKGGAAYIIRAENI